MKKLCLFLALLLTLSLCGCSLTGSEYPLDVFYPDSGRYSSGNAELSADIRNLEIDWASGSVKIIYHDGDCIRLEESSDMAITEEAAMHYLVDGNTLRVRFTAPGKISISLRPGFQKDLVISLPRGTELRELETNVASADVILENLSVRELDWSSASGDLSAELYDLSSVNLDSASGDMRLVTDAFLAELHADSASGDLSVEFAGAAEADADSASGDINLSSGACSGEWELESASGNVTLRFDADADFTAEVDSASGEFSCDFPIIMKNNRYTCGSGALQINIDTASGDIRILSR